MILNFGTQPRASPKSRLPYPTGARSTTRPAVHKVREQAGPRHAKMTGSSHHMKGGSDEQRFPERECKAGKRVRVSETRVGAVAHPVASSLLWRRGQTRLRLRPLRSSRHPFGLRRLARHPLALASHDCAQPHLTCTVVWITHSPWHWRPSKWRFRTFRVLGEIYRRAEVMR